MPEQSELPETAEHFVQLACRHFRDHAMGLRSVMRDGPSAHDRLRAYFAMAARPEAVEHDPVSFDQQPIESWYLGSRANRVMQIATGGIADAHEALRKMYNRFDVEGSAIPDDLSAHCFYIAAPKRRRGAPITDDVRDLAIALVIALLERGAILPTRNPSLREIDPPTSGCSIVRHALWREYSLALTDSAIEKIWEQRDKAVIGDLVSDLPDLPTNMRALVRSQLKEIRPN